jgi:DNA-binding MarR family transcriptional regulator
MTEATKNADDAGAANGESSRARFVGLLRQSGQDVSCSRPVISLLRADGRVGRAFDHALSPSGLTEPQFNVLMELAAHGGGLPHCTLAQRILKSPANVTSLVDRMERDGLVHRVRGELDRRTVVVEISDEGWSRLETAAPAVFAAERAMLTGISSNDLERLRALLDRVAAEPATG